MRKFAIAILWILLISGCNASPCPDHAEWASDHLELVTAFEREDHFCTSAGYFELEHRDEALSLVVLEQGKPGNPIPWVLILIGIIGMAVSVGLGVNREGESAALFFLGSVVFLIWGFNVDMSDKVIVDVSERKVVRIQETLLGDTVEETDFDEIVSFHVERSNVEVDEGDEDYSDYHTYYYEHVVVSTMVDEERIVSFSAGRDAVYPHGQLMAGYVAKRLVKASNKPLNPWRDAGREDNCDCRIAAGGGSAPGPGRWALGLMGMLAMLGLRLTSRRACGRPSAQAFPPESRHGRAH